MIKKLMGFIIVGAICFIGGYLLAVFNQKHSIFSATKFRSALAIAQDPTQAVALLPGDENKSAPVNSQPGSPPQGEAAPSSPTDKGAPNASSASPASPLTSKGDKKEEGKNPEQAKEGAPKDQHLLASLWMVKKNKASELSNTGLLYMDGTSPYGLPQIFKEDLFASENMLTVPEDPHNSDFQMPPLSVATQKAAQNTGQFWLQLGAFPSIVKAQKVASYFLSKGYQVDLYQGRYSAKSPAWHFVRLKEIGPQNTMLKKARVIRQVENMIPTLVEYNTFDKKL